MTSWRHRGPQQRARGRRRAREALELAEEKLGMGIRPSALPPDLRILVESELPVDEIVKRIVDHVLE